MEAITISSSSTRISTLFSFFHNNSMASILANGRSLHIKFGANIGTTLNNAVLWRERERERERQTDRQTETETEILRNSPGGVSN